MSNFIQRLEKRRPILLDGGLATSLEALGEDLSHPLWSGHVLMESPEKIVEVYRNFISAACEILSTATYQLSIPGLKKLNNQSGDPSVKFAQLMQLSVDLAVQAREKSNTFIAGSMGPYGAYLADGSEFTGNYSLSQQELKDFHKPRTLFFEKSPHVDVLAFETIPSLTEALAIAELLNELKISKPAWISFSCRNETQSCAGDLVSKCAQELEKFSDVSLIGVNCTQPQFVSSLLKEMNSNTKKPLIAYPNSGERWDPKTKSWSGPHSVDIAKESQSWIESGAVIIGGCCRVDAKQLSKVAANLYSINPRA